MQDKQAVVLQYMRFSMKLDDLDDVMKILQQKNVSSDLVSSAFRTARYLIDEAPEAKRVGLSSKLLQYQQGMPEENLKILYRLLGPYRRSQGAGHDGKELQGRPQESPGHCHGMGDWNTDDAVPYLFRAWKDESLHSRVRSQAHDSILRVLSVDRDRDDNATIKLFEPLIADAKTSDRRRFLVSAFKRLSNRPYVIRLLGRIKQAAEENSNKLDSRLRAAEEALVKAEAKYKNSPDDARRRLIMKPRITRLMIWPMKRPVRIMSLQMWKRLWKRSRRRLLPSSAPERRRTTMTSLPSSRQCKSSFRLARGTGRRNPSGSLFSVNYSRKTCMKLGRRGAITVFLPSEAS